MDRKSWIGLVVLTATYAMAGWLGIRFGSLPPGNLTVIWLPSGIALAGLIIGGWRLLPAVFIGSALVNSGPILASGVDLAWIHVLTTAAIDSAQSAIAFQLYQRFCPQSGMHDTRQYIGFLLGAAFLPVMATTWALVLHLVWAGVYTVGSVQEYARLTAQIMSADILGIFLIVPVIDSVRNMREVNVVGRDYRDAILLLALWAVTSFIVNTSQHIRPVVQLIPLTALALRSGVSGASMGIFWTGIVMIASAASGHGPYSDEPIQQSMSSLTTFILSIGIPVQFIAISSRTSRLLIEQMETRVEERTAQLKSTIESKDRIMSIIAHDLKGPFNGILGLSDIMVKEIDEGKQDELREYAMLISQSAQQASHLLQNLLEWARAEEGRLRCQPVMTDLKSVADRSVGLYDQLASQKGIRIHNDIPHGMNVVADVDMLSAILRNLVSNAIKFTPKNGDVTLSAINDPDGWGVAVADNGVGMEGTDHLFRPDAIRSTRGTEGETGSGLGLLLVDHFVRRHSGQIRVESQPGAGTTFTLAFPHPKPTTETP